MSLTLAGCFATEGLPGTDVRAAAVNRNPTLLVATTRQPVGDPPQKPWFSGQRGRGLVFAEARLSPPDRSLTGRVASVVTGDWSIAGIAHLEQDAAAPAFAQAARARRASLRPRLSRELESAVSAAQLSDGIGFRGATALFTWPSAASTFNYVGDRESAMWSRDALEDLLTAVAGTPSGGRVHIVAHSMGTLLTLETSHAACNWRGHRDVADRCRGARGARHRHRSFHAQRGTPRRRCAQDHRDQRPERPALAVSGRLAGGVTRAGAAERERLEALGVRVADASEFGGGLINHDLFLSNKEVQQVVKRAMERVKARRAHPMRSPCRRGFMMVSRS